MLVYKEEKYEMLPMAMNAFYYNIPLGTKKICYSTNVSINEEFLNRVIDYIDSVEMNKNIFIDMQSVDYAFRLFEKFQKISRPIIFMNIDSNSLRDKLKDNLPNIKLSSNKKNGIINADFDNYMDELCVKYSSLLQHKIYVQIVKELIDDIPKNPVEPLKLDSSGLYSNMYVNVKRLFLYPEKYYAVVYGLAKKIVESKIEFNGFVSSSKNGALLANLLGMMLDKKAIHIMGIGPKYSMNIGNIQKEISKRKNYIYVYDFRCTGTEMKILSALVNANDAYIKGAVGIAVYKNEDDTDKSKMMYLVDIRKEGIPYTIAGEKKNIIQLMTKC